MGKFEQKQCKVTTLVMSDISWLKMGSISIHIKINENMNNMPYFKYSMHGKVIHM